MQLGRYQKYCHSSRISQSWGWARPNYKRAVRTSQDTVLCKKPRMYHPTSAWVFLIQRIGALARFAILPKKRDDHTGFVELSCSFQATRMLCLASRHSSRDATLRRYPWCPSYHGRIPRPKWSGRSTLDCHRVIGVRSGRLCVARNLELSSRHGCRWG